MSKEAFVARHFPRFSLPRIEDLEMSGVSFTEHYNQITADAETPTADDTEGGDNA